MLDAGCSMLVEGNRELIIERRTLTGIKKE